MKWYRPAYRVSELAKLDWSCRLSVQAFMAKRCWARAAKRGGSHEKYCRQSFGAFGFRTSEVSTANCDSATS